jgi:hypothetical protein
MSFPSGYPTQPRQKLGMRSGDRHSRREARLKREFAHLYPPLKPGEWESAAVMADKLVRWLMGKKKHGFVRSERVLRPEHFEFRDGEAGGPDQ